MKVNIIFKRLGISLIQALTEWTSDGADGMQVETANHIQITPDDRIYLQIVAIKHMATHGSDFSWNCRLSVYGLAWVMGCNAGSCKDKQMQLPVRMLVDAMMQCTFGVFTHPLGEFHHACVSAANVSDELGCMQCEGYLTIKMPSILSANDTLCYSETYACSIAYSCCQESNAGLSPNALLNTVDAAPC